MSSNRALYEIKRSVIKFGVDYRYTTINSKNQTLTLSIYYCTEETFNVEFFIANKRKHGFQGGKIIGADGIKSLIWAKNCIADFISYYRERSSLHNTPIVVYGETPRLRKIYYRYLKPLGFYVGPNNELRFKCK